jgi:pyruvate kinase
MAPAGRQDGLRRTKIVATIGPASESPGRLRELIESGLDLVRLNFSHGTHAQHGKVIAQVRALATELGRPIAILQDLAGPKIRTGPVRAGEITLAAGQDFTFTARDVPGDAREVGLTYKELPQDVRAGDRLLLSDGALELEVVRATAQDILCRVLVGGPLSSRKGINLPSRSIGAELPTAKDLVDLEFGIAQDVDYVALSYVRHAEDVLRVRRRITAAGRDIPLIAKIENQEALDRIEEILAAVDGIMVARGDLGVEIPIERVPGVQKSLIDRANRAGKPVITATQMLRSMVDSPRPTRAEVTDVANAVLDGTDALMLSEETAVGRDPAGVVRMMGRIAREAERGFPHEAWAARFDERSGQTEAEAIARSAWRMAERLGAAAILTLTISGSTTRLVARYRPRVPLLAVTPAERTCRRLAAVWGAVPVHVPARERRQPGEQAAASVAGSRPAGVPGPSAETPEMSAEEWITDQAIAAALKAGRLQPGQTVVVTAGLPLHVPGITNHLRIVRVGHADS